ncbi:hypothetical protein [Nocardioides sp. NPDC127503]|uniref:hypothetical protein n=1 Tax=Nocardioides sp. NPDC127503 TaxID=3154516 RepID=UPI0033346E7B
MADEKGAALTVADVTNAMLVAEDLPGTWHATDVPVRTGAVPDAAAGGSECGQATHKLALESSRWGAADVNAKVAWASSGGVRLQQEVASVRHLEADRLGELLGRQASECGHVVVVNDGVTVESQLRSCGLSSGDRGVLIVQSWTASDGRSGSTRLAYIVREYGLVVLTYTSSDAGGSCQHAVFDRIVDVAAAKAAH